MSYNFNIPPTPVDQPSQLTFHQYIIYDSINWNQSGTLQFNQTTGNFEVFPNPMISGLYHFDAMNNKWTSINFNPTPGSSGTMRYDDKTKSITLI